MDDVFQNYFDSMPCFLTVQERDLKIVHANSRFVKNFGDPDGRYCYQVYKQRPEKCEVCPVERSFRTGQRTHGQRIERSGVARAEDQLPVLADGDHEPRASG